jgi:hypothetical protein
MVEATKGCDINQGKYAKRVKSTKFVKQILLTYTRIFMILGFTKQSAASSQNKNNSEELSIIRRRPKFCVQNDRVGGG